MESSALTAGDAKVTGKVFIFFPLLFQALKNNEAPQKVGSGDATMVSSVVDIA